MDEFSKIQELSDDIMKRKEPSFTGETEQVSADDDAPEAYHFMDGDDNPLSAIADDKSSDRRRYYLIGALIGVLALGGIGVGFFATSSDKGDDIIVIAPDSNPVRVKPENPGGVVIPDQDKMIYNRVANENETPKVEKLFPEPEKPVLPEIIIQKNTPEPTFVPVDEVKGFDPLSDQKETVAGKQEKMTATAKTVVPPKKEIIELPAKIEAKSAPVKAVQKETWRVQLMASSKQATTEKAWPGILKKNKALLSNMSHDVVVAKIPGKGTFYRLQVGQFTSKDKAVALCKKLKANKQECVPVRVEK